jgi:hypothetical protein
MKFLFKKLYSEFYLEIHNDIWSIDIQIYDIGNLLLEISKLQKYFQIEKVRYLKFENAILEDLIALKKVHPKLKSHLNYLQLHLFTNSIHYFNRSGEFNNAYNSIILSIRDSRVNNGETLTIDYSRIFDYKYSNNIFIYCDADSLISLWLQGLYYCSYKSGAFVKFCEEFWDEAEEHITHYSFDEPRLELATTLLSWNNYYKWNRDFNIIEFLLKKYNCCTEINLKDKIGLNLSVFRNVSIPKRIKIFKDLDSRISLAPLHRLQFYLSIINTVEDYLFYESIIKKLLIENNRSSLEIISDKTDLLERQSSVFHIINSLIEVLGRGGEASKITELISIYYNQEGFSHSNLYLLPIIENGVLYVGSNSSKFIELDSITVYSELVSLLSQLLNKPIAIVGGGDLKINNEKDIGIPKARLTNKIVRQVDQVYNFKHLSDLKLDDVVGMIEYGINDLPLQAIMINKIGKSFPINISFSKPLNKKEIENIVIFTKGSITSEIEKKALVDICEANRISYKVVDMERISRSDFIQEYKSLEYSIIWVASHGSHNHYNPQSSLLQIQQDEEISLQDLLSIELKFEYNRLLFFNLCEGGTNSGFGGIRKIGFGHLLTNSKQSIVSHLWMVNPFIASFFGVCFAIGCFTRKLSYFESFSFAVDCIIQGKMKVIEEFEKEFGKESELIVRVTNTDSIDWEDLLYWGSPVFYN